VVSNPVATLGAADFLAAIDRMLPPGRAFPGADAPTEEAFWGGVADLESAFHQDLALLTERERDPSQTSLLLPLWETAWGLPDPCIPQPQTQAQRRAALVAKIGDGGGESIPTLIAAAARYGYTITITEFVPARVGRARCGGRLIPLSAQFTFQVNAPNAAPVIYARAGVTCAGEPLRSASNATLECVIGARLRATRSVTFNYV